ncbi:MAG: type II toxin-antitoxin system RelE/ParE family toxin [Caldilineaceae bacterium SB0665_bin_25]|nr:type II toxin-antitoxin system RelE/ParE family toxin [Caldilineaceae bacterium SB0665_bin_25]
MPRQSAQRVRRALDKLSEDPDRRDVDIAPLEGRPGFRLRVGGYRVILERDDEARTIDVLRVAPRGQAYRQ